MENDEFEIYKQEPDKDKPSISYIRSKYANWEGMLKNYNDLREQASIYASVLEFTQEIKNIKKICGLLGEIWDLISYMQGKIIDERIETLRAEIWSKIKKHQGNKQIDDVLRFKVLKYKRMIYKACWHSNLSFDVEKIQRGSVAKHLIVNN